jgi:NADPH-dependent 2,4-dienoyl-CoA reductase/sulfur reductase-like enzyme
MADRILVVGGNAAGMTAASRAKRLDPSLSVAILEGGPRIASASAGFPSPGRTGELLRSRALHPETLRNERGISPVNRGTRSAIESGGRVEPRKWSAAPSLRQAPSRNRVPPAFARNRGDRSEGVFTASRLGDGEAIPPGSTASARRAVILGGGYVGLELVRAVERGLEVTVVERAPRSWETSTDMASLLKRSSSEKEHGS